MIAWAALNFVLINVVLMMTNQIVVLFAIFVIPMYVSDSDPCSSEVEIIASTCFVTVKSFLLPQCRPKQTPVCSKNGRWPPYVDSHIGGQQFRVQFPRYKFGQI
jgi:hypothetical protein